MYIRKANKDDDVTSLILSAARELFESYEVDDINECASYLFSSPNNKFSYENSSVCIVDEKIVGLIIAYDSSLEVDLAKNQEKLLFEKYNKIIDIFDNESIKETTYIDTFAVLDNYQNKGIGSKLLNNYLVGNCSLLCLSKNKKALKFYEEKKFKKFESIDVFNNIYYKMLFEV